MKEAQPVEPVEIVWNGITRAETIGEEAVARRNALADAAREARWETVIRLLKEDATLVNVPRLQSASLYAPLHQAAHHGARSEFLANLIEIGAWRTLRSGAGDRPLDIALRKGHAHLAEILTPKLKRIVGPEVLSGIQSGFHRVIRERAGMLIEEGSLRLPQLEPLLEYDEVQAWFPIPGMCGGFSYRLEIDGDRIQLIAYSWCRVVEGSEQRHVITSAGYTLDTDA